MAKACPPEFPRDVVAVVVDRLETGCVVRVLRGVLVAIVVVASALPVGSASAAGRSGAGYWVTDAFGVVTAVGDAPAFFGPYSAIVAIAAKPGGQGYWIVGPSGAVFSVGDAGFYGSAAGFALRDSIVGIAPTPSGHGYWLAGSDGGVFAFGDARFHGSAATLALRGSIVGIAPTPSGHGYWLAGSDGGVFAFGDARFHGSAATLALRGSIVGIAPTGTGRGYWLAGSDGGVFAFGDAQFHGSRIAFFAPAEAEISAIAASPFGSGYMLLQKQGAVLHFGTSSWCGPIIPAEPPIPVDQPPLPPAKVGIAVAADRSVVSGELAAVDCNTPGAATEAGFAGPFNATGTWHLDVTTAANRQCRVDVRGGPLPGRSLNPVLVDPTGSYHLQIGNAQNPQHYSTFSIDVSTEADCLVVARAGAIPSATPRLRQVHNTTHS